MEKVILDASFVGWVEFLYVVLIREEYLGEEVV